MNEKFRVKIDTSDKMPGWKFSQQEILGIPLRIEIGPKDIENNQCVIVRRDTREKVVSSLDEVKENIEKILSTMQSDMYEKAKRFLDSHIVDVHSYDELKLFSEEKTGFAKAMWCGCKECEQKIKEDFTITSRCMPFDQTPIDDKCVVCGEKAEKLVYWGKAY